MIPSFSLGKTTIRFISPKEWRKLKESSIKHWHWEKTETGFKPVADRQEGKDGEQG
jgi:hypothetical protein